MQLTPDQVQRYQEDGFIVIRNLFDAGELAAMRAELERLDSVETDHTVREDAPGDGANGGRGAVKTIFRVHEPDGPTRSPPFFAATRSPRLARHHPTAGGRRTALRPSHQMQPKGGHQRHGLAVASGLRLLAAGRHAPAGLDYRRTDARPGNRGQRLPLFHPRQPQARPAGAGVGRADRLQALGGAAAQTSRYHVQPPGACRHYRRGPATLSSSTATCCTAAATTFPPATAGRFSSATTAVPTGPEDVSDPRPDYVRSRNWAPLDVQELPISLPVTM